MSYSVPYLPIGEFESDVVGELKKQFQNEKEEWSEMLMNSTGDRIVEYMQAGDGYSPYVELVLQGMGMQKYVSLFEEQDIGIEILVCMNDDDLVMLGITDSGDRKCILEHLKQFRLENNDVIQYKKESDFIQFDIIEDDITIVRNVHQHLVELNSHLAYLQFKLSKNPPKDYLLCSYKTGLNYFKFVLLHAAIQSNRMSDSLFGQGFYGRNMINHALNVNGATLTKDMKEKLMGRHKKGKKLRIGRVVTTVLIGIGIIVAINILSKRKL